MDILELALHNQQTAWNILEHTGIIPAWERIGATVHLVGSLKSGLLAKEEGYRPTYLFRYTKYCSQLFCDAGTCRTAIFKGCPI